MNIKSSWDPQVENHQYKLFSLHCVHMQTRVFRCYVASCYLLSATSAPVHFIVHHSAVFKSKNFSYVNLLLRKHLFDRNYTGLLDILSNIDIMLFWTPSHYMSMRLSSVNQVQLHARM